MTKIKICGLSRSCDIDYINVAMPDFCGFIINVPSSRRNITVPQLRSLRAGLRPGIVPVGVFVDAPEALAAQLVTEGLIDVIQLHGHEDNNYIERLRAVLGPVTGKLPGGTDEISEDGIDRGAGSRWRGRILQAFKIREAADVGRAMDSTADILLLDGGAGDGRTFDWSLLSGVDRPYFLAGGLGPHNLAAALETVAPWGVDMSSGVETDGFKDRGKIMKVMDILNRGPGAAGPLL